MVKITINFVGEPKAVAGMDAVKMNVNNGAKLIDIIEKLAHDYGEGVTEVLNSIKMGRYLVLIDGVAALYLDGLNTPVDNASTISIVHMPSSG